MKPRPTQLDGLASGLDKHAKPAMKSFLLWLIPAGLLIVFAVVGSFL